MIRVKIRVKTATRGNEQLGGTARGHSSGAQLGGTARGHSSGAQLEG
jgi:hypothetical protein